MALVIFQQAKGAKRTMVFDFTDALASDEDITAQSAAVSVHDGLGDSDSTGAISDIARDDDNQKVSLAYSNTSAGLYEIEVTAITANQTIKQKAMVEVV